MQIYLGSVCFLGRHTLTIQYNSAEMFGQMACSTDTWHNLCWFTEYTNIRNAIFSLSLSVSLSLKATRRFQDAHNVDPCVFPKQGNIKTIPENASALPPEISHKLLGHTYVAITIRATASSTRDTRQNVPRHVKHVALGVL